MSAFTISRNRVSYHVSFPLSYYYCFTWFYTRNKKRLDHKRWTHHHSTHAFSTRSKTYDTQTYASAGVRGDRRGTNVKLTPRINDVIIDRRSKARGSKRATCVQSVWNGIRETFGTKKPLFPLNHEFLRAGWFIIYLCRRSSSLHDRPWRFFRATNSSMRIVCTLAGIR